MCVVVTGGAGFIGAKLMRLLSAEGESMTDLGRFLDGAAHQHERGQR